jgi:predicted dehydrogenase
MTIGAGIIGLGFMGRRYAETLVRLQGVRVAALCDARPDLAMKLGSSLSAPVFPSAAELVEAPDVDVVFVCTPEDAHVEPTIAALERGKAVLIEKPVAHTLDAADRIRQAANATDAIVMVGHLLRFEPRWATAWRLIASGELGDIVSIATRRVGNVRDQEVLRGRTSIPLYYGVHDLDIVNWFAGARATSIHAVRRDGVLHRAGFEIEDLYCAILCYENGIVATAELGWHLPPSAITAPASGITVVGTRGWLRIEQGRTGLECYGGEGASAVEVAIDVTFWPEVHGRPTGALTNELEHFLDCVRTGRSPVVSLDDAIEALRLSLAMESSATSGRTIEVMSFGVSHVG